MPKTLTHNAILLRPPPGTRFSIYGQDVELQFERGKEGEMLDWLQHWLDAYVRPEMIAAQRGPIDPTPEVTALKARIQADQRNPGITQGEQKLAAMGMSPVPATQNHIKYDAAPLQPALKPGVPVVYGPNGPMSADEINSLPDRPIPGVGYVSPNSPVIPTGEGEGHQ